MSLTSSSSKQGAKKVSFTASHLCKLQLACTSPRVTNEQDWLQFFSGLEIATDTVANATNIFSLVTKNSSLVAKLATRFLYDLDLN